MGKTREGLAGRLLDAKADLRAAEEEAEKRAALLEEAQALAHLGSWEWDLSTNRFVWSEEMFRIVGLVPGSVQPDFDTLLHMVHPQDVDLVQTMSLNTLRGGETLDIEFRIFLPTSEERVLHSRGRVIVGDHGRPIRVVGTTQDVTERRDAERALRAAQEAADRLEAQRRRARMDREYAARLRALNESLLAITAVTRVRATLRRAVEQAARMLDADRVVIDLAGSDPSVSAKEPSDQPVTASAGASVAPPGSSILLPDGDRLTPVIRTILEDTREPMLLSADDAPRSLRAAGADPVLSDALRGLVAAPLVGPSGEVTGTFWATGKAEGGDFSEMDLAAFVQLAQIASIACEKARRFERERAVASMLQRSLLPESLPEPKGATLTGRYVAGGPGLQVGGDWYDAIELRPGELAIVIGDVEGHGVRAAAAMGQLRNAVRAYAWEGFGPADALTRLNDMVEQLGDGQFSTLSLALIDVRSGGIRLATAGHPPPLVIPRSGKPRYLDVIAGPPMGALRGVEYREIENVLDPGDTIFFYTDGLVESRSHSIQEGLARLTRSAQRPGPLEDVVDRILDEVPSKDHRDDIAVVAVALEPVPASLQLRLPAEPASLATLRAELRAFLTSEGVPDDVAYDTTLAASEAAANAIEHPVRPARRAFEIQASKTQNEIVVDVRDFGSWSESSPASDRGRGLQIIAAVADFSVERGEDGTTVTLRRRLDRTA